MLMSNYYDIMYNNNGVYNNRVIWIQSGRALQDSVIKQQPD